MMPLNDLAARISLDGTWDFRLGDQDAWSRILVPGAWEAQGYDRRLEGPAYYRRQVTIPEEWAGARIFLEFEAVSYACRVSVNGIFVGEHQGMWTPFACDLSSAIQPGRSNLIEVEVYKPSHLPGARYPFRKSLAGFIPDLATTFGGLWQEVSLRAYHAWFKDWHLIADMDTEEIICSFGICSESNRDVDGRIIDISISLQGDQVAACTIVDRSSSSQELRCRVSQPRRWSLQDPVLYDVEVRLRQTEQVLTVVHRRIGFRRLSTRDEVLLFNDRPILLRGILHWGWMPERIAPSFSQEAARAQIREIKRLGFNLIKLCLFIPNPTFYEVADEEGIFLWQEWPMWLPQVDSDYAARAPAEYAEYMSLTHHHPSIVIYSAGCELDETVDGDLLERLSAVMRQRVSGTLFCDNSGMGEAYGGLQVDFADFADYHTYSDLDFFEEVLDHWRRDWLRPRPLIFGEFCDSDTYRDPEQIRNLSDGEELPGAPPWWLTNDNPVMDWRTETHPVLYQKESIEAAELNLTPRQLQEISYAGSLAVRKYVLETVRRRAGIGGYVITGLRDTPISTSGIFDDFESSKWDPGQFLLFNGEYTLCLDGERRRRWQHGGDRVDQFDLQNEWAGERVNRRVILSGQGLVHQGPAQLSWRLTESSGQFIAEGENEVEVDLKGIRPQEIAALTFQLPPAALPQELRLDVEFSSGLIQTHNSWSFWIYPKRGYRLAGQAYAHVLFDPGFLLTEFEDLYAFQRLEQLSTPPANKIVLASAMPAWAEDFLNSGGRMILLQWEDGPLPVVRRPFWREAVRIFVPHPIWDMFGIGGDLRFLGMSSDVSFDSDRLVQAIPALDEVHPIFRRLDARDFRVSEYLLEAPLGRGVLLACSLRLAGGHGRQPSGLRRNVAGQALLWTMLDYLERKPD
jgi:hypothetical protein